MSFQRTLSLVWAANVVLLLLGFATSGANAQGLTTLTQEDNGQVVTTSIPATVYTTENQVFTWQPTTPPTPTPSIVSRGSVLNVQDFQRVDEEEFRKDSSGQQRRR
ncbi:hypothetical protein OF846_005225 [Rhodotorula toruloides]|nr:hypothetical protein OF846_005225 [Rhodotorula toruloides]